MSVSKKSSEAIDEAAGDWLARRDGGAWTAADQADFECWLNASDLHRVAYLRVEHAWEEGRRLKALGAGVPAGRVPPRGHLFSPIFDPGQEPRKTIDEGRVHPGRRLRWAAAAVATVLVAIVAYLFQSGIFAGLHYSTPVGEVASVPLVDGSNVTLNTDSKIAVAISSRERRVYLERGEVFFEVAKDPAHAFIVEIGDKRVIAVGTKFAVRREAGNIRVVVIEGKVRVEIAQGPTASLTAGAVALSTDAGTLVRAGSLSDAEDDLAWLHGVLVFHETTLAEATAEFNRYNNRKIVITDSTVGALRIAGAFRSSNLDGFVRLLEQGYPIRFAQQGDQIVLMGSGTHNAAQ
jgi:transmembrane sensor